MVLNLISSSVRHLKRHPLYTVVNVFGLALGVACALSIASFVRGELSFDAHNEEADQIIRIVAGSSAGMSAATPRPLARALEEHLPSIDDATRLSRERADRVLVSRADRSFFESDFLFADADVFDVFTIPLKRGHPETAIAEPFSIVITEAAAKKYFSEEDPIGKTLRVRLQGDRDVFDYTVTAVAADLPKTSHFHFDFLASYEGHPMVGEPEDQDNWMTLAVYTYARVDGDPSKLRLDEFSEEVVAPVAASQAAGVALRDFEGYSLEVQPLRKIHLQSDLLDELEPNGSLQNVLIFSAIALFVLLLACINFVNLSTARATIRAKEIGIRKVLGSARQDLAALFMVEAYVTTAAAFAISVVGLEIASGVVDVDWARFNTFEPLTAATILGLFLVVGFAAGSYPALYLSSMDPSAALASESGFLRGSRIRKGLIVVQIGVTATLLVCTAVVVQQMRFVAQKDLGFNRSSVVVIEGTEVVRDRIETFKNQLAAHPAVESAANSEAVPGRALSRAQVHLRTEPDRDIEAPTMTVGFGFVETMDMRLIAGRAFSPDMAGDSTSVILNETAAAMLGRSPQRIIGAELMSEGRPYVVVGVVRDYHQTSLRSAIEPTLLFGPDPWNANRPNQVVAARLRPDELTDAVRHIRSVWNEFVAEEPLRYSFLDTRLETQYAREQRDGRYFAAFSILAVAIACFGLVGLAGFTTRSRSREVGIRKIHGASALKILKLFFSQLIKLTGVAFLLAVPTGYLVMNAWLGRFAYRVAIDPLVFVLSGAATLLVVLGATAYQVVRAARMNPVDILRQ